eukprot:CAMPEP_0198690050 /NCGR_PEP_ID=MMETSP1468-20131203/161771_1 /TAXON_ID=1461545 /ORGANISM="Mantoniella sp, Strain CCMP1436" /LENGTH=48 /DNA_ID= /DNA_START= /DNA_END= /DNA_ORIENTATION=
MKTCLGPSHDFCKLQVASCVLEASLAGFDDSKNAMYYPDATDRKKPAS